jgi:hypothetical protein
MTMRVCFGRSCFRHIEHTFFFVTRNALSLSSPRALPLFRHPEGLYVPPRRPFMWHPERSLFFVTPSSVEGSIQIDFPSGLSTSLRVSTPLCPSTLLRTNGFGRNDDVYYPSASSFSSPRRLFMCHPERSRGVYSNRFPFGALHFATCLHSASSFDPSQD